MVRYVPDTIDGVKCVFYANEKGVMWFGVINGDSYGAHAIRESDDIDESIGIMRDYAKEFIEKVRKTL